MERSRQPQAMRERELRLLWLLVEIHNLKQRRNIYCLEPRTYLEKTKTKSLYFSNNSYQAKMYGRQSYQFFRPVMRVLEPKLVWPTQVCLVSRPVKDSKTSRRGLSTECETIGSETTYSTDRPSVAVALPKREIKHKTYSNSYLSELELLVSASSVFGFEDFDRCRSAGKESLRLIAAERGLSASSSANGGHGFAGLGGFSEVGFLVFPEVVHIDVAVGFEPVLMGFDG